MFMYSVHWDTASTCIVNVKEEGGMEEVIGFSYSPTDHANNLCCVRAI